MKNIGLRIFILASVVFSITVVFFIGFKLNIAPHIQSEMDRWVGIATVCTAISSAIVGLISVWVMFDQKKMQQELMAYQKMEHQPIFKIKLHEHPGMDDNGKDATYEDLVIQNVGNQSMIIKNISINVFITWTFDYYLDHFLDRIYFYDYFVTQERNSETDVIFTAKGSRNNRNLGKYLEFLNYANNLPDSAPYMDFEKDILVKIEYIDLYNETKIKYFRNGYPIDEETYSISSKTTAEHTTSLAGFNLWEYKGKHHPSLN